MEDKVINKKDIVFNVPSTKLAINFKDTFFKSIKTFPATTSYIVDMRLDGNECWIDKKSNEADNIFLNSMAKVQKEETDRLLQGVNRFIYDTESYRTKIQEALTQKGKALKAFFVDYDPPNSYIKRSGILQKTNMLVDADILIIGTKQEGFFSEFVKSNKGFIDKKRGKDLFSSLHNYRNSHSFIEYTKEFKLYVPNSTFKVIPQYSNCKENVTSSVMSNNSNVSTLAIGLYCYMHYLDLMYFTLLTRSELISKLPKKKKEKAESKVPLIIFDYVLDMENAYNLEESTLDNMLDEIDSLSMYVNNRNDRNAKKIGALELSKYCPFIMDPDSNINDIIVGRESNSVTWNGGSTNLEKLIKEVVLKDFTFFIDHLFYYTHIQDVFNQFKDNDDVSTIQETLYDIGKEALCRALIITKDVLVGNNKDS